MNLRPFGAFLALAALVPAGAQTNLNPPMKPSHGIVIHGGAGVITREKLTPELESRYRAEIGRAHV